MAAGWEIESIQEARFEPRPDLENMQFSEAQAVRVVLRDSTVGAGRQQAAAPLPLHAAATSESSQDNDRGPRLIEAWLRNRYPCRISWKNRRKNPASCGVQ